MCFSEPKVRHVSKAVSKTQNISVRKNVSPKESDFGKYGIEFLSGCQLKISYFINIKLSPLPLHIQLSGDSTLPNFTRSITKFMMFSKFKFGNDYRAQNIIINNKKHVQCTYSLFA